MMLQANQIKHTLKFKTPGGTSRGILTTKPSWLIKLYDDDNPKIAGIGECSIIPGLSFDDHPELETQLNTILNKINHNHDIIGEELKQYPSIRFGLETAKLDLKSGGNKIIYQSEFTDGLKGIPINGLIWMGSVDDMKSQIRVKLDQGYKCLKLKIGAININDELDLIKSIRKEFSENLLELRVDANGAFTENNVNQILENLSNHQIHSIEQPIKQGQWHLMSELCRNTPIPIALDEELIGISDFSQMNNLLQTIMPQYIIIKPGLLGGFSISDEWIKLADKYQIGWWITSALESNIGLNAIAQYTYTKHSNLYQGLGTGQLFTNNFSSPLEIRNSSLYYNPDLNWDISFLENVR